MERALSAPGKLFLAGEYAVLWGGVARVAAVGPRLRAHVRRRPDARVHVVLDAGALRGSATPGGVAWDAAVPAGFAFVARALDEALRAHGRATTGLELALSPGELGPGGRKLGLGGSATATVLAAEAARFVLEDRFDALRLALLAHAGAQGGKGSGGDVAAAFAGGVLRYRRYDVAPLLAASTAGDLGAALGRAAPVDLWRLPAPRVAMAYAFSGESASTRVLIAQAEARLGADGRRAFAERSDAIGLEVEAGLAGDFERLRAGVAAQRALLQELGDLETDGIRRILALAEAYGCTGKLSGAGGGDGCILFAPDAATRATLLEGLAARGLHAMPLEPEGGLRGEVGPDPTLVAWLDAAA